MDTQFFVDLTPCTNLQSLSWRGIAHLNDFDTVRKCLVLNIKTIKHLILDLIDWTSAEHIWFRSYRWDRDNKTFRSMPDNFFARKVLGIFEDKTPILLESLQSLTLSALSFSVSPTEMAHAFNMSNLHTLKLFNCPYSLDLLLKLANQTNDLIKCKSFELVLTTAGSLDWDETTENAVSAFLQAFHGLEDLYLMLPETTKWKIILESILYHEDTLQRLVLHNDGTYYGGPPLPVTCLRQICHAKSLSCMGLAASMENVVCRYFLTCS
jgi:hypothetical protein